MRIPTYVKELMERSTFVYDHCKNHPNYGAGYTIKITKRSAYSQVDTLRKEVERLVKWANSTPAGEIAFILDVPTETHHVKQVAVVTIFDPIMQQIEKYIAA